VGYTVTAMAFSPDSISIAIGQTDGIVFVYRIGEDFKMKKSITNKFSQPAPVAAVVWPNDIELFAGLMDGKIRLAHLVDRKSTKCTTAYSSDSCVARMSAKYGTFILHE
jgi:WD40 repeat protein